MMDPGCWTESIVNWAPRAVLAVNARTTLVAWAGLSRSPSTALIHRGTCGSSHR